MHLTIGRQVIPLCFLFKEKILWREGRQDRNMTSSITLGPIEIPKDSASTASLCVSAHLLNKDTWLCRAPDSEPLIKLSPNVASASKIMLTGKYEC